MKIDAGERERLSAKIDEWVRTGNGNRARHLLHRLSESGAFHRLPREEAAPIAALARRSGLPMLGLALLTPYVRPSHRRPAEPTPREKAEYAGCLAYVGATGEALEILKTLDAASLPMVYLFRSFAHISRWEYAMAIPYLKLYVRAESLTPYQRLVGRLNLADALVQTGNTLGAGALLRDLLHRASIQRHGNLTGKALEIAAQKFIFQKRWSQAEPLLERAEWLLRDSESLDLFFVRKWKAVISLFRDHRTTRLESVRAEALQRHHWETARDCDRFRAIATRDQALLELVYFGTPFPPFRDRLIAEFGRPQLPETYRWEIKEGANPRWEIDLVHGECRGLKQAFKFGQIEHKLLQILSRDFYRPIPLASLHAQLYPGEHFSPVTSPARVHNSLKRLRRWCEKSRAPLAVAEDEGFYRLRATRAGHLRVAVDTALAAKPGSLGRLRALWGGASFSKEQAARELGVSGRTAQRLLRGAEDSGDLARTGTGPATRFRFKQ